MRGVFIGALPMLVAVWVSFAVFVGAVQAVSGGGSTGEAAQAGLGLCVATVACFFSAGLEGLGKPRLPGIRARILPFRPLERRPFRPVEALVPRPRSPEALQVFLT